MTISLAVPDILVARARAGDLEALEALYRAFETPVYNLARRMLRHPEEAEDVLQETFLEVVKSIRSYRGEGPLWAWIRKIAASKALMRIRSEEHTSELQSRLHLVCRLLLEKKKHACVALVVPGILVRLLGSLREIEPNVAQESASHVSFFPA